MSMSSFLASDFWPSCVRRARSALVLELTASLLFGCVVDTRDTASQGNDIVDGSATHRYPAVGALLKHGRSHCTGTLIAPRRVLTAAHCLDQGLTADALTFAFGSRADDPDRVVEVVSLTLHPDYVEGTLEDDIGYVTLGEDVSTTPMALSRAMGATWIGTELRFVGFGRTASDAPESSGIKRVAGMRISWVGAERFNYLDATAATCQGDSGGPAVYFDEDGAPRVVGVHSTAHEGCSYYGTEMRVDAYVDFLTQE